MNWKFNCIRFRYTRFSGITNKPRIFLFLKKKKMEVWAKGKDVSGLSYPLLSGGVYN